MNNISLVLLFQDFWLCSKRRCRLANKLKANIYAGSLKETLKESI